MYVIQQRVTHDTKTSNHAGAAKRLKKEIFRPTFTRGVLTENSIINEGEQFWPAGKNEKITDSERIFLFLFFDYPFFAERTRRIRRRKKSQNKYLAPLPTTEVEFHYFYESVNLLQFLFRVLKLPAKLQSKLFSLRWTSNKPKMKKKLEYYELGDAAKCSIFRKW